MSWIKISKPEMMMHHSFETRLHPTSIFERPVRPPHPLGGVPIPRNAGLIRRDSTLPERSRDALTRLRYTPMLQIPITK